MVPVWPPETWTAPHWWQNNAPKTALTSPRTISLCLLLPSWRTNHHRKNGKHSLRPVTTQKPLGSLLPTISRFSGGDCSSLILGQRTKGQPPYFGCEFYVPSGDSENSEIPLKNYRKKLLQKTRQKLKNQAFHKKTSLLVPCGIIWCLCGAYVVLLWCLKVQKLSKNFKNLTKRERGSGQGLDLAGSGWFQLDLAGSGPESFFSFWRVFELLSTT